MTKSATRDQIAELDRLALKEFGLDILQMMEVAGNRFALSVRNYLKDLRHKHILVLAGLGNNGGDGLCAARYLANWGAEVKIILARLDLKPAAKHQLVTIERMGIESALPPVNLLNADLIVDALLGYNQVGAPKPPYDNLISQANELGAPIFALDNPSGLDADTGMCSKPTIKAHTTVTLAAVKNGLITESGRGYVGNLELVDLGIPKEAYERSGLQYPFESSSLLK